MSNFGPLGFFSIEKTLKIKNPLKFKNLKIESFYKTENKPTQILIIATHYNFGKFQIKVKYVGENVLIDIITDHSYLHKLFTSLKLPYLISINGKSL